MTLVKIPVTTYYVSSTKPKQRFGVPARFSVNLNRDRVYVKVPFDRIPLDATITSASLVFFAERADANGGNVRAYPVTQDWKSSITWNNQPTRGALIQGVTPASLVARQEVRLDVLSWAITRSRRGMMVDSATAYPSGIWLRGSDAPLDKPYLEVEYIVLPDAPTELVPAGGHVSVPDPVLSYVGEIDMTRQQIQLSADGVTVDWDSGWVDAVEPQFNLLESTNTVVPTETAPAYWRVRVDTPRGPSPYSEWAQYTFAALPEVVIVNPPETTSDGSPVLEWTVEGDRQTSWKAELQNGGEVVDLTDGWQAEPAVRSWSPKNSVPVPGGTGRYVLWIQDDKKPRVSAVGADTYVRATQLFTTELVGAGTAINSLNVAYEEPVVVLTGVRNGGTPDEFMLLRDDVPVPLWGPDGTVYTQWAPGADFFNGVNFVVRDYTASLGMTHTWAIWTRTNGTEVSAEGPTASYKPVSKDAWVVDPMNGDKVRLEGIGGSPSVSQSTEEMSVIHTPISGGLVVEPRRRRVIRTTASGSVEAALHGAAEIATFEKWVLRDSSYRYRLIFGRVNWSVILGDYSPSELVLPKHLLRNDLVGASFNWWQRLNP